MEKKILIRAGIKKHRGSLTGVMILLLLTACSLCTVLSVYLKGNSYIREEMQRAGFGDLTAWVSGVPDMDEIAEMIRMQEGVAGTQVQQLLYMEYEANGMESDSEGQLILWEKGEGRYRFLRDDLSGYREAPEKITQGEVYVSPSMISMMGLKIGDSITFPVARGGQTVSLVVSGYYEDPFMGSSMIGMKGFLISQDDYKGILEIIQAEGMDALERDGAMLHVTMAPETGQTVSELNQALNEGTPLPKYVEFIQSADAIAGFMTILQNAFCGLLAAFALVLLFVAFVVLSHSISGMVEQDFKNLGILKTVGLNGSRLVGITLLQYGTGIAAGLFLGILASIPVSLVISRMTVTTSGVLIPAKIPFLPCLGGFTGLFLLLMAFSLIRLRRIHSIKPMDAIRSETCMENRKNSVSGPGIRARGLSFYLALRQILSGKRRYVGSCVVAALLVFFASLAGRMEGWLGSDGKGMMDAFNPADLDIGVQVLGDLRAEEPPSGDTLMPYGRIKEMEDVVLSYSDITDSYMLAMPDVAVNGNNYTANVISEPERFHISRGQTCKDANEVVLTETVALDLGVDIGDVVTVQGDMGAGKFMVSGIYHCANDMGANLGMSREGYLTIGWDDPRLWCYHYFLADTSRKQAITEMLEQSYGGDVHVHENTWPGLFGIIAAMHTLLTFLYGMSAVFICIVTVLAAAKILDAEQKDLSIYKSIGCSVGMLRWSFAMRFGVVAAVGAVIGILAAIFVTDPLVSAVMRRMGISNFASHPSAGNLLAPGVVMILLFVMFAYLAAGKIKKEDMAVLTAD